VTDVPGVRTGPAAVGRDLLRTLVDDGRLRWLGWRPLRRHVVLCGWPRSGTTLLELIVFSCVQDVWTWPEEVPALLAARDAFRTDPWMCTKDPRDVGRVDAIRAHYRQRSGEPLFVVLERDPRDVLTSTHDGYPPSRGYYCSPARWRGVLDQVRAVEADPDVLVVRFEDLVTTPWAVQQRLSDAAGWTVTTPFERFHEVARRHRDRLDDMTRGALGGLRPLDPDVLGRWHDPAHVERLRACLEALPELPQVLVDRGHAEDARWVAELAACADA
jgi:hypothetical protein